MNAGGAVAAGGGFSASFAPCYSGAMPPLLVVRGVAKSFRVGRPWRRRMVPVLRALDLAVEAGEIVALLGSNGAGKTTLLKLLASLLTPDGGRIEIGGVAPGESADARRLVGFASGEERSLFFRLTGRANLEFFGALYGLRRAALTRRIDELADALDLRWFLDRRVDLCSSGMRARLGLARALLHEPRLVLLDEPTKSLDPEHAARMREELRRLAATGVAVVMATHLVAEASTTATRSLWLADGRLERFDAGGLGAGGQVARAAER